MKYSALTRTTVQVHCNSFYRLTLPSVSGHVHNDVHNTVVLVSAGFWDVKKVAREHGTEKFVEFKITLHEELQSLMKGKVTREGIPVTQALFICDVKGASLAQTSLDGKKQLFSPVPLPLMCLFTQV